MSKKQMSRFKSLTDLIPELQDYYGVKEGRPQKLPNNSEVKTQKQIADEQRVGEILLAIPKASGGVNQCNKDEKSTRVEKSKTETISDMGYTKDAASDYQHKAQSHQEPEGHSPSEGRRTGEERGEGETRKRRQSIHKEPWVKFDPTLQYHGHGTHSRDHGAKTGSLQEHLQGRDKKRVSALFTL